MHLQSGCGNTAVGIVLKLYKIKKKKKNAKRFSLIAQLRRSDKSDWNGFTSAHNELDIDEEKTA